MSSEPLFDKIKRETGIDIDKMITDGIDKIENFAAPETDEAYPEVMETVTEEAENVPVDAVVEDAERVLTLRDRCDSCGAAAQGYAEKDGMDLLFCRHHVKKNEEALLEAGFTVYVNEEEKTDRTSTYL